MSSGVAPSGAVTLTSTPTWRNKPLISFTLSRERKAIAEEPSKLARGFPSRIRSPASAVRWPSKVRTR